MTNFSRDSYSPVSDNSIVFMQSPVVYRNLSEKNVSNSINSNNEFLSNNNDSSNTKELAVIREENTSKSGIHLQKQSKKSKKTKAKSKSIKDKYPSLPTTPFKTALMSTLNPALDQLEKSLSATTTPTKPIIERFKNRSKMFDSHLRKLMNNSSTNIQVENGVMSDIKRENADIELDDDKNKNKKVKRKEKKADKEIKVRTYFLQGNARRFVRTRPLFILVCCNIEFFHRNINTQI